MSFHELKYLIVDPTLHPEPAIGVWLWALNDARRRTHEHLHDLTAAVIDWHPAESAQSIGSILYHIALIEADWLYTEVLEQPYPKQTAALFPYDSRDQHGLLTSIQGVALDEYLARLDTVRQHILATYQVLDLHDFRRVRHLADYDVTPEWVLHYPMQHEAEHRSEIGALQIAASTTHCVIVFVAVDEGGEPVPVPAWIPVTDHDIEMQRYAKKLMDLRKGIENEMARYTG